MWLSSVTYDLVAMRALDHEDVFDILLLVQNKKADMSVNIGDGSATPEFPAPPTMDEVDPNLTSLTIKRAWSTQDRAQEFADFAAAAAEWITATVEQET